MVAAVFAPATAAAEPSRPAIWRAADAVAETRADVTGAGSFEKAAAILRSGNGEAALKSYDDLLKNGTKSGEVYLGRGHAHMLLKQWKEAAADFDRAIALKPNWYPPYDRRGDARYQLDDIEAAREDFEMVRKLSPSFFHGYTAGAAVAMKLKKPGEGIDIINLALKRCPPAAKFHLWRGRCYEQLNQLEKAHEDFSQAVKMDAKASASWYELVAASRKLKRYGQGRAEALKWTSLMPKDALAWSSLGYLCDFCHRADEAAAAYTKAAALEPGKTTHIAMRAASNRDRRRYRESIVDALAVIEKEPHNADMYSVLATDYIQTGNPARSIECASNALKLSPSMKWMYEIRAQAHYRLEHFEEAVQDWTAAIACEPKEWHYAHRAKAYLGLGQAEAALSDLNTAIKMDPSSSEFFLMRARVHQGNRKHAMAIADYSRALQIAGPSISVLRERSISYKHEARYEDAIRDLTGVIKLIPTESAAYADRAKLYEKLGNTALAKQDRARAQDLSAREVGY